jgi:divalent metal cation (Fe/Co/Zn/Cd) transporter
MSGHVIAGAPPGADRASLLDALRRLAVFTVVYNVAEGAVAIAAAMAAGSRALAGFGLDSGIESISGAVLLWRLRAEQTDPDRAEAVERRALRLIGVSFLLLAAYVAVDAIAALARRDEPDASVPGIVLTVASLVVMPVLARRKRRVAVALGSRAAEADSKQTTACVYLSAVVLAGLVANAAFAWWWADPVAALGVVVFLVQEGREALTAEQVDDCC